MLQAHWRTLASDLDVEGESPALPAFVVAEVEAFLAAGQGECSVSLMIVW
jgi:hypothetical protein